jgi:hypothetical protein
MYDVMFTLPILDFSVSDDYNFTHLDLIVWLAVGKENEKESSRDCAFVDAEYFFSLERRLRLNLRL